MTELTARCASTQAVAKCDGATPFVSQCALRVCAARSDSSRNSVCIIRASPRPARVPGSGLAPGAYLAASTPRAIGL